MRDWLMLVQSVSLMVAALFLCLAMYLLLDLWRSMLKTACELRVCVDKLTSFGSLEGTSNSSSCNTASPSTGAGE